MKETRKKETKEKRKNKRTEHYIAPENLLENLKRITAHVTGGLKGVCKMYRSKERIEILEEAIADHFPNFMKT